MKYGVFVFAISLGSVAAIVPASASNFTFSTGNPDGLMAAASRSGGAFEIETADDFILGAQTSISSATFTGLIPTGAAVQGVTVEIYRVFPADSNTAHVPTVPTRVNSPSDVEFADRSSASSNLTFSTSTLNSNFTANNSVAPGGIHPFPGQTTGGNGAATGQEVRFSVTFTTPFVLPSDHYFFVPQVQLTTGDFLWLSAPKPIVAPGTPFSPDLQAWTRDQNLDPDWLRIGTDIVGGNPAPTFNMTFSLAGDVIDNTPLPASLPLFAGGLGVLGFLGRRRKRAQANAAS